MTATKKKAAPKAPAKRRHVATGRPRGRPSPYTQEHKDEIIRRLADGQNLREVCRMEGMPTWSVVYDWVEQDEAFSARFARARVLGFDAIAHDALTISNTPLVGEREKVWNEYIGTGEDRKLVEMSEKWREDMLGHRKLQIETRLKLLSKWDPKRYGDRLDHTSGGEPLKLILSTADQGVC